MKKTAKRVLSLILAVLLFAGMTTGVMAAGTVTPAKGTQTVYLSSKTDGYGWVNILLATGTKDFTLKRSSIKITKGGTGATMYSYSKTKEKSSYVGEYISASGKWLKSKQNSNTYNCSIGLDVSHTGTAKIKYKIGSKAYTTKVKVLAYKNPVKSVTLTGVNGGKSFAYLTKDSRWPYNPAPISSSVSSATLKVTPAKGWKILEAEFYGENYRDFYSNNGVSSLSLNVGSVREDTSYSLWMSFINTSNGAVMSVSYDIGNYEEYGYDD